MPTYEYACRSCGEHLEVVQSFKDDALTTCPNCEGELRKVFSAAGIIFKGSGWHVKDYAAKSGGAAAPAPAGKDGGSESGASEGSSDSASGDKSADSSDKASGGGDKGSSATTSSSGSDTGSSAKSA